MSEKATPSINFDANYIKSLPVGEVVKFDDYPGLRLEISTKYRTWIYRYKSPLDSRMRQKKIGRWPALSFPKAIAEWESFRNKRENGIDLSLEQKKIRQINRASIEQLKVDQKTNAYTVAVLCDQYLNGHVKNNRQTKGATEIKRMFATMLDDIADIPAKNITRSHAFDLIEKYKETAPVQAGKLRCELGAAWDYALDAGRLPDSVPNWWRLILKNKIQSKGKSISGEKIGDSKRALTEDELVKLIKWLPNFSNLLSDVLTMYIWTATRGAEIVGMTGSEVTVEQGQVWWTIPKKRTKNAKRKRACDHRVPLYGAALDVVMRRKELYGDGFLFPAKPRAGNTHVQQKTIQSQVFYRQPYCVTRPESERPRLTVTHWAPHDLRRSSRTLLSKLGCPSEIGEIILGHLIPGVAGLYDLHKYDSQKQFWLGKLSDYLHTLLKPQVES